MLCDTIFNFGNELPPLLFPLVTLIDHCGVRILATSIIPVSKDSLILGSCNLQSFVSTTIAEKFVKRLAKDFNLKSHLVGYGYGNSLFFSSHILLEDAKKNSFFHLIVRFISHLMEDFISSSVQEYFLQMLIEKGMVLFLHLILTVL